MFPQRWFWMSLIKNSELQYEPRTPSRPDCDPIGEPTAIRTCSMLLHSENLGRLRCFNLLTNWCEFYSTSPHWSASAPDVRTGEPMFIEISWTNKHSELFTNWPDFRCRCYSFNSVCVVVCTAKTYKNHFYSKYFMFIFSSFIIARCAKIARVEIGKNKHHTRDTHALVNLLMTNSRHDTFSRHIFKVIAINSMTNWNTINTPPLVEALIFIYSKKKKDFLLKLRFDDVSLNPH